MKKNGNKTIIVLTGATRGLGRALVDAMVARDHIVVGCGRAKSQVHALTRTYPHPHRFTAVDVGSDAQVKSWVRSVLVDYGPPDFLLNNAGLINEPRPLWEITDREFSNIIDVNLRGTANTMRHLLPAMLKRGRGVIVNFSSGWGRSTSPDVAPYCATKWAVEGLTQSLAQELPKGMAAVTYSPGMINTEMLKTCFGKEAADYPSPEEWAKKATPFLLKLGPRNNGQSLTSP